MKIKRYMAPSMRVALALVRAEQGPDAVILSSRRVRGGHRGHRRGGLRRGTVGGRGPAILDARRPPRRESPSRADGPRRPRRRARRRRRRRNPAHSPRSAAVRRLSPRPAATRAPVSRSDALRSCARMRRARPVCRPPGACSRARTGGDGIPPRIRAMQRESRICAGCSRAGSRHRPGTTSVCANRCRRECWRNCRRWTSPRSGDRAGDAHSAAHQPRESLAYSAGAAGQASAGRRRR